MIPSELILKEYDKLVMRMENELSVIRNNSTEAEMQEARHWDPLLSGWILHIKTLKREYSKQIKRSD